MAHEVSWAGYALRNDVSLRSVFPNLVTRIFETTKDQFLIVFDPAQQHAEAIAEEFNNKIKMAGVGVRIANAVPASYLRELEPLDDVQAAGDFVGLPLNRGAFNSLVVSRFPDLPLIGVGEDLTARFAHVLVERPIKPADAAEVVAFVENLRLPLGADVQVAPDLPEPPQSPPERSIGQDLLAVRPAKRRPSAPAFVARDEAFWFENLGAAAAGRLPPEQFPTITEEAYRCFIDFAVGKHVNLRQALLLYDEVYCSLPLTDAHEEFLADQGLSDADLLMLAGSGRLKFISTQPEERLRLPFLEALDDQAPQTIMGRRTAALLLIADIARSADSYRPRDPAFYPALRELSETLAPHVGLTPPACLRAVLWPLTARRQSLYGLMERGTKSGLGIELAKILAEAIQAATKVDIALEAMVASERVHLGHALNATVFGALDEPGAITASATALGQEMNFYQSFNTSVAAAWVGNERRRADGVEILPPIPLLEFDPKIPIAEVLEDGALSSTRVQGRALIKRIADLPQEARQEEVNRLVDALRLRGRRREGAVFTLDNLDTGVALGSLVGHFTYPPIAGVAHAMAPVLRQLRRVPAVDRMLQILAEDLLKPGSNQDLEFLSRISRVAQLRRPKI
jgi:hypothetical protein